MGGTLNALLSCERAVKTTKKIPIPSAAQLRGIAKLATQATVSVSRIAEGVHQSVWGSMGVPGGKEPGQTRGLTGLIYQSVRGVTQLVGAGADKLLGALEPVMALVDEQDADSNVQVAILAALNGVMGDQLAADNNPLSTTFGLRFQGQLVATGLMPKADAVSGKIVVLIHGLCMNDLQWADAGPSPNDLGAALAKDSGFTPVYARYNTGLHTSENGSLFAAQISEMVEHWPVPVTEIAVVAHSMGGLVTRSAVQCATDADAPWLGSLKKVVFLGTPHHGAPLEQAGSWVDVILGVSAYSRPFKRLAQLRSSGITDLRHGHVLASDWQGRGRFERAGDQRTHVALPRQIACFTVGATLAAPRGVVAERLLGDGLVPLNSALGKHDEPQRCLAFAKSHQFIAFKTGHIEMLHSVAVRTQVLAWLASTD